MFESLDQPATHEGFASLIGIARPNVTKMAGKGRLPPGGTYRDWLTVYCQSLRETAAGRAGDGVGELTQARTAQALADAEWKRLQIFERANQLADTVQPMMDAWAGAVRNAVLAAGERILESVESSHQLSLDRDVVLSPLRTALRDSAGYPLGVAGSDGEGGAVAGPVGADLDGAMDADLSEAS